MKLQPTLNTVICKRDPLAFIEKLYKVGEYAAKHGFGGMGICSALSDLTTQKDFYGMLDIYYLLTESEEFDWLMPRIPGSEEPRLYMFEDLYPGMQIAEEDKDWVIPRKESDERRLLAIAFLISILEDQYETNSRNN